MLGLAVIAVFLLAATLAGYVQYWAARRFADYRREIKDQASQGLRDMFLFLDPAQLWSAGLMFGAVTVAAVYVMSGNLVAAVIAASVILYIPQRLLLLARQRRLAHLENQLPDFLMGMAAVLRAGASMHVALRHMHAHTPAPLSQELALVLREQRMGVTLDAALQAMQRRVPTEGCVLLVSALIIASHSGGSLATALEQMAATLRARLQMQGRIRALTSQGRMQAWVMAALPPFLALVLQFLDPEAMQLLWHTPAGWGVLVLIAVLELAGLLMIRRIVNVDV